MNFKIVVIALTEEVIEVTKLGSKVIVKTGSFGNFENRSLEKVLGIKVLASACEQMKKRALMSSNISFHKLEQ